MKELQTFIEYGNKAPSSHNAKMWKPEIDSVNSTIRVTLDKKHTLPQVDPHNREAWISMGAFVQNIVFAASDFGYASDIDFKNEQILIHFSKGIKPEKNYRELLSKRHTTRKVFSKNNIDDVLSSINKKYEQNILYFNNQTPVFDKIIQFSQQANKQQINHLQKRKELSKWICFDKKDKGMSLKSLGMNGLERFIFRNFIGRKGFVNSDFVRKQYIKTSNKLYSECAGYLLILSRGNTPEEWLHSGILLEKIWVELTSKNICVQPMSQLIEEEPYYSQFKKEIQLKVEVQMLLRLGMKH